MKLRRTAWLLFGLSIVLLLALTLFESALVGMSLRAQRLVTLLLLVLPSAAGSVVGMMSLIRKERRPWLAVAAVVLNGLFALFHLMVVLFAG